MTHFDTCPTPQDSRRFNDRDLYKGLPRALRTVGALIPRGAGGILVSTPQGMAFPPPRQRHPASVRVPAPSAIPVPSESEAGTLAEIERILSSLVMMDDGPMMETAALNPWIVQFLQLCGMLPSAEDGASMIGFDVRDLRAADDAFSAVWDTVKGVVPYGNLIDAAHQARRQAMYGPEAGGQAPQTPPGMPALPTSQGGAASVDQLIREMQGLSRRKRKGDPAAASAVRAMKLAAVTDGAARRRWAAYVAVTREDQRMIDGTPTTSAVSGVNIVGAAITTAALRPGLFRPGSGFAIMVPPGARPLSSVSPRVRARILATPGAVARPATAPRIPGQRSAPMTARDMQRRARASFDRYVGTKRRQRGIQPAAAHRIVGAASVAVAPAGAPAGGGRSVPAPPRGGGGGGGAIVVTTAPTAPTRAPVAPGGADPYGRAVAPNRFTVLNSGGTVAAPPGTAGVSDMLLPSGTYDLDAGRTSILAFQPMGTPSPERNSPDAVIAALAAQGLTPEDAVAASWAQEFGTDPITGEPVAGGATVAVPSPYDAGGGAYDVPAPYDVPSEYDYSGFAPQSYGTVTPQVDAFGNILDLLMSLPPDQLGAYLAANPWILQVLADAGLIQLPDPNANQTTVVGAFYEGDRRFGRLVWHR